MTWVEWAEEQLKLRLDRLVFLSKRLNCLPARLRIQRIFPVERDNDEYRARQ